MRAGEVGWHFTSFDANGGTRLRQEMALPMLCNRQRPACGKQTCTISPSLGRVRRHASRGQGNVSGKTTNHTENTGAARADRRARPAAILPRTLFFSAFSPLCS